MKNIIKSLICLVMALCVIGLVVTLVAMCSSCTSTRVDVANSNGSVWTVRRLSCMQKVEAPRITIDGVGQVTGYSNDGGADALSTIVEAAVRGAMKGAL